MRKIILASQSPRRAEILKNAGYSFVSFPVFISEIPNENLSLDEQIIDIARRKARACLELYQDLKKEDVILASDTMVCYANKAIGKPDDEQDAFNTLKKLSGQVHQVKTAVVLIDATSKEELSHIETTDVEFEKINDQDILDYIKTKEPMDKAGSYAIQGLGNKLVKNFTGDFNNVVGLPLNALENLFSAHQWIFKDPFSAIQKQLAAKQHLLAVSKLQPKEKIVELYNRGQQNFGENYVQEALEKIESLKNLKISWHLIGPLQKNKVKHLKTNFSYIHSVDSFELAELIDKKSNEINHVQKVFLQINLSDEITKSGFTEENILSQWPKITALKNLAVQGLMTMPPLQNEPEMNRPFFKKLRKLSEKLNLQELSMGTSHDYKIALEEGATWIRIGTVLFGEREKLK